MLYPQSNPFRQTHDLSGFWELRFDPHNEGHQTGWAGGFTGGRPVAVPASWNEQFEDNRDYFGKTWYQTRFSLPWGWQGQERLYIRFGSVSYAAEVWLNGTRLGTHEGGHLPFEFNLAPHIQPEDNLLVVCVEGEPAPDRVPPGNVPQVPIDTFVEAKFPDVAYDFFPFCGIHRPVLLYTAPALGLADFTVITDIAGPDGHVSVKLERLGTTSATAHITLNGFSASAEFLGQSANLELTIPTAIFWSPQTPHLYDLTVEIITATEVIDRYTLPIGIRTIKIDGDQILLNGQPIYLRGFGRHEDFPITGRGLVPAVIVKDYSLMQWMGANSFRTTHYPYSEEMMDLADRLGFLVIDETPAVGLFFTEEGLDRRLALCRQYTQELIDRDKNHPCVIAWSLANEPHSNRPAAKPFFRNLADLARSLDSSRPITLVTYIGVGEESFEFLDLVCLNRYFGWYSEAGQLDLALPLLSAELDALHTRYAKPLIVTEFGADTVAGHHAQPPELFSEEYQVEMILGYIKVFRTKPFVVGEHIWNLCDFKTAQSPRRVGGLNLKGLFTRDRRPKLAAHKLRELWLRETS
jgi:beta-glucuronidase